jgi:hypothetical protein
MLRSDDSAWLTNLSPSVDCFLGASTTHFVALHRLLEFWQSAKVTVTKFDCPQLQHCLKAKHVVESMLSQLTVQVRDIFVNKKM